MQLTKEQKILQTVITKAWENESYKKELIKKPVNAIEELTGVKLNVPKGKKVVVVDQTDSSTVYINIPAEPNMDDIELNETQLEIIAGGGNPIVDLYPNSNSNAVSVIKDSI